MRPATPPPVSPVALDALVDRLAGRPGLFLLDVDGTLAPIAERPEEARVPAATLDVLARLVAAPGTHVALVTGRLVADARRLVPVDGLWIVGVHGAEVAAPDGALALDPRVAPWADALAAAAGELAALLATPGVRVEDKRWTVAVHHRLTPRAHVPAVQAAVHAVAARHGLRVGAGKEVLEVRPPVAVDKGSAILALVARLGAGVPGGALLFAGDDVTDEDGFRALAAAHPHAVTVRVGDPRTPTAAGVVVPDPAAVAHLLARVVERRAG